MKNHYFHQRQWGDYWLFGFWIDRSRVNLARDRLTLVTVGFGRWRHQFGWVRARGEQEQQ